MATIAGNNARRKRTRRMNSSFCPGEDETLRVLHRFDMGIRAMKQYGPQSTFLGSLLTYAYAMEGDYRATLSSEATMYNVSAGLLLTIGIPVFLDPPEVFDPDSDLFRLYMYSMGISVCLTVISLVSSIHLVATGFGGYACSGDLSAFVFKSSFHGHAFEAKLINAPLMLAMASLILGAGVYAIEVMNIAVDGAILCGLLVGGLILSLMGWQTLVDWHIKLIRISDLGLQNSQLHWSTELNSQYSWYWKLPSLSGGPPVTFKKRSAEEIGGYKLPFTCGGLVHLSASQKEMITRSSNFTEFHAVGLLRNLSRFYDIDIPEPKGVFGTKHFPGGLYRWMSTWELKPEWKYKIYGSTDGGLSLMVNQAPRPKNWADPMPSEELSNDYNSFGFDHSTNQADGSVDIDTWSGILQKVDLVKHDNGYSKLLQDLDICDLRGLGVADLLSILQEAGIKSLSHRIKIAREIA